MGETGDFATPEVLRLQSGGNFHADIRTFRDAMASMASTACLVTTQFGGERLGRTVTSVFSLAVEPPAILVSIDTSSRLVDHIVKTGRFAFSLLAQGQEAIADAFAGKVEASRRFDIGRWASWDSGHPRLDGALAAMDCEVLGMIETGTHLLFAGGVLDIALAPEKIPLIWHERRYKTLTDTV